MLTVALAALQRTIPHALLDRAPFVRSKAIPVMVAIVLVSLATIACGQTPRGLIGTCQLVSRIDTDPSGKRIAEPSLGANPVILFAIILDTLPFS
jgi:hypothetical protein